MINYSLIFIKICPIKPVWICAYNWTTYIRAYTGTHKPQPV